MSRDYLCLIAKSKGVDPALRATIVRRMTAKGLSVAFERARVIVFTSPTLPFHLLIDNSGVALGDLFERDSASPFVGPVKAKDATTLISRYWGSYVAIFDATPEPLVLRDPGGGLACYETSTDQAHIYSSRLDLLTAASELRPSIHWCQLRHLLHYPGSRTEATGLNKVSELLPGCVALHDNLTPSRHLFWSPWAFTRPSPARTANALKAEIRRAVELSVMAWSHVSPDILMELSGGLDSSIVATCLTGRMPRPHCANLVTNDGGADERRYAQPVADALGVPLSFLPLTAEPVELPPTLSLRLPVPGVGVLQSAVDVLLAAEARRVGATAFFSGGGGDNVFCFLHTAVPATDVLHTFGPGPLFHRTLQNLSRLHECSYWTALRLSLRKYVKGPRTVPVSSARFLNPDEVPAFQPHPWMAAPKGTLPGQYEHVAALVRTQNLYDLQERAQIGPMRYPLLSQPVVEACLAVPSWMWIEGGRNRSLARDAFSDRLPPLVAGRRTKGEFTGFCGEVYEAHRAFLRHYLLGGLLAEHRVLDRQAVETYLSTPTPPRDIGFCALLDLAGVETWCRQW